MPLHRGRPAPYGPPAAVIDLVEAHRQRALTPITTDTLRREGVADSLVKRVLTTLRLLDLIDEQGRPTGALEGLRLARSDTDFDDRRKAWLLNTYAEVLEVADPRCDPHEDVAEAFRGMSPDGQRSRMVTLMCGLFDWAGLIEPDAQSTPSGGTPRMRSTRSMRRHGHERWPPDLPPALVGMLRQIPRVDGRWQWTTAERERFLSAFTAVLEFSVDEVEPSAAKTDIGGELSVETQQGPTAVEPHG